MSHDTESRDCNADQLMLAGHFLRAMERGLMPMNALEYRETTVWATHELARLDTAVLNYLRSNAPVALRGLVENLLQERRERTWAGKASPLAEINWTLLRSRLMRPSSRRSAA